MPPSLQAEISICLYKPAIDRVRRPPIPLVAMHVAACMCMHVSGYMLSLQVPLFDNTELGFTKLLALSIKPVFFLRGEYIMRKGDIGNEVR